MAQPLHRPKLTVGPSKHVYDVLVFGGQLGGTLAAALLAKRGYRVLWVEHDGLGPGYEHGGFLLPYAPSVIPALRTMPAVEDAFTELGLTTTIQRATRPHQPELQLVLEHHRLDLPDAEPKKLAELRREFGPDGAQVASELTRTIAQHEPTDPFFREVHDLPPDGLMEEWGLKGKIRQHPALDTPVALASTHPAAALLRELRPFLSYRSDVPTPLGETRVLSQALKSPGRYPNGREGLRELLVKKLQDLGGDVLVGDGQGFVVEHLSFEGSKLVGLQVVQSDNVYRGAAIVAATDAGALRRLIADKKQHRKLVEQLDLSETKKFLFTVNWVVPASVLPRGMGELLLMAARDEELGPVLIQQHPAKKVEGKDDESLRVICAGAFIPSSARELGEAHLKKLAEKLEAQLEWLMPFAKSKRVLGSAPYLDAGGVRGSRLLPHPLYGFGAEHFLGVTGLSQRTSVKNLFLAGREILPGLGFEGELLAGIRAARLVQQTLKKENPLKR